MVAIRSNEQVHPLARLRCKRKPYITQDRRVLKLPAISCGTEEDKVYKSSRKSSHNLARGRRREILPQRLMRAAQNEELTLRDRY